MRSPILGLLLLLVGCQSPPPPPSIEELRAQLGVAFERSGSGPIALVFVHGWACDRGHWRHQVPAFQDRFDVITLDLAGHGDTTVVKEPWEVTALADEVVNLVLALNLEDVILVGHSMGGTVALAAAPSLEGRLRGIVGVDCLQNADFQFPPEQAAAMAEMIETDFAGTMETMLAQSFAGTDGTEEAQAIVLESTRRIEPAVAVALSRSFLGLDFPTLFREAGVPVRCINVAQPWPTEVEINRRYADYDAVVVEDATHFLMLEQPDRFNALLAQTLDGLVNREAG